MKNSTTKYGIGIAALVAVLAMSTVAIALSQSAVAAPANKSAFGGAGVGAIADDGLFYTIAAAQIKTSGPSDLVVTHNQECTIHTGLNLNNEEELLTSAVREDVRLKVTDADNNVRFINPVPLGVEGEDDAAVTMCGRAYEIDTNVLSTVYDLCAFVEGEFEDDTICADDEIYFDSFIRTKAAHGWDWVVPNMGAGVHTIEIQAALSDELGGVDGETTGKKGPAKNSDSDSVDTILEIGKRSLIITEQKLASDI